MQVDWTPRAQADVTKIRAYIAEHDVAAANRMTVRIVSAGNALEAFPHRGRPAGVPHVRELVVSGTPYLLVYRVLGEQVQILSVWHGAQDRDAQD